LRHKLLPVVLLLICVGAGARIAMPFYRSHRLASEAEANRYRPNPDVLNLLNSRNVPRPSLSGLYPCVAADLKNSQPQAQLTQCGLLSKGGPVDRFEVDLRYGNFIVRESDLYLNDVFDVPLTRTYNSGDFMHPNPVHAFGRNANHPYDIGPVGTRNPYTYLALVLEDGNFLYFPRASPGTSYFDAIYQQTEAAGQFYKAVTSWNGNGWTTWRTDGSMIIFPEAARARNLAQGAPTQMRDGSGNALELQRDKDHNLQEILTPHQHSIKFEYDFETRIVRAEDDAGHWAKYHYNQRGLLADVVLSSGHERHYAYEGVLMTEIDDETGQCLLRNSYDGKAIVRQDFGNGQIYSYSYTRSPGGTYVESVVVTLPDGTQTKVETASSVPAFMRPQGAQ